MAGGVPTPVEAYCANPVLSFRRGSRGAGQLNRLRPLPADLLSLTRCQVSSVVRSRQGRGWLRLARSKSRGTSYVRGEDVVFTGDRVKTLLVPGACDRLLAA